MNAWICLSFAVATLSVACAELPFIEKGDLRGCFAMHKSQRYEFVFMHDGEMWLVPKRRSREPVAKDNRIKLEYGIEELQPDGTAVFKQTRQGSLESEQEADDELNKVVIRGTTTGDAVYELVLEQSRDIVSIGGHVVDAGSLTKQPLRFTVRAHLPNVYRRVSIDDRDEEKEFEKQTRRDYMELVRIDHSKLSLTNDDSEKMDAGQITGSGIEEIEMRLSYYEGRRFFFTASRNSGIAISNDRSMGPWYEGMTLHWTADAALDPEHKGRFSLCVK